MVRYFTLPQCGVVQGFSNGPAYATQGNERNTFDYFFNFATFLPIFVN